MPTTNAIDKMFPKYVYIGTYFEELSHYPQSRHSPKNIGVYIFEKIGKQAATQNE